MFLCYNNMGSVNMKILIIPSWYPNSSNPVWGNYFIKQAEALNDYADVSFLNINRVGIKEFSELFKLKKQDGFNDKKYSFKFYQKSILNVRTINLDWSYKRYQKAAYKAYKKLEKIIGKPDIILVESILPAGLAALYISQKENIPYIIHHHSYDVLNKKEYVEYDKPIIEQASCCMAVNDEIKKRVEELGKKCVIMPNYIDTKRFKINKKLNKKFILINICNFYKVKALEILLQALNKVVYEDNIKDIKLNIIGTGDYEAYYKDVCSNLKLNKYVNFMGYVNNNEIPKLISESDVLCVSSRKETFCIPILEAFASGKPVISTKCGGPNKLINNDRGVKVSIDDVEEYRKAIINMKKNYKNYNSEEIKEYAYNNFDKEIICNKIINICKKVIQK